MNYKIALSVILVITISTLSCLYYKEPPQQNIEVTNCKEDSLREVIQNLKGEIELEENGWSFKEQRYEDILFEYRYGLSRLKEKHPEAYKEFHRSISFKERYSVEDERENKKRLNWEE